MNLNSIRIDRLIIYHAQIRQSWQRLKRKMELTIFQHFSVHLLYGEMLPEGNLTTFSKKRNFNLVRSACFEIASRTFYWLKSGKTTWKLQQQRETVLFRRFCYCVWWFGAVTAHRTLHTAHTLTPPRIKYTFLLLLHLLHSNIFHFTFSTNK